MLDVRAKSIRFGKIEVDASRASITVNGRAHYPRQQTLQVLLYLIERRERLVTKDEIIENIWQGTAVTDNALVQCIAEIRRLLGDDPRRPKFVKTFPKVGYRFVAEIEGCKSVRPLPVDTEDIDLSGNEVAEELALSSPAWTSAKPISEGSIRSRNRRLQLAVLAGGALLLIAFATSVLIIRRSRANQSLVATTLPEAVGKNSVAVMYFDNQSGDRELDWLREGLADMLITDLSNSKRLTVLSRQQLHLLLERIGHSEPEKIGLDEALEVAQQSRAKIVILGRFARLGEQIRIDVQLHNARDGQLLAAERLVAERADDILAQVDLLSLKLASHLGAVGESTSGVDLTSVMTNNLEAYRYYSLGVEKANALHNSEAISLFKKAVTLDGEFAMAHARIGYTYAVSWARGDDGRPYLEKAFQLSDRLTEKDKAQIKAWYAIANLDYAGAIKSFQEILARYPLEVECYRRLGELLRGEERFEEAIEVAKQGLVIDSGSKELYNLLGAIHSQLGRHDAAIAMFQRYVELAPEEPNAHDSLGLGLEWAGRYEEAITEYRRALVLKPNFEIAVIHLGNTYFQQGRYREAIQQYRQYIGIASGDNFARARGHNCIAHIQRISGRLNEAQKEARMVVKYEKNSVSEWFFLALEKGDLPAAERFQRVLETVTYQERGARGSLREYLYVRGSFDLKRGRWSEALESFNRALRTRPLVWNLATYEDCLANAYLELGRLDEAIAEYERILKLNPNYPLVHYHMAQAYERKGDNERAREEYTRFLQIWKDADEDVPEVIAAKRILSRSS